MDKWFMRLGRMMIDWHRWRAHAHMNRSLRWHMRLARLKETSPPRSDLPAGGRT